MNFIKSVVKIALMFLLVRVSILNAQVIETLYGSTNSNNEFTSIVELQDKGYIISGSVSSSNGFGGKDIYVQRIDVNCNVIWSRIYGSNYDDVAHASLINDSGNILLACSSFSNSSGANSDIVLIEVDLSGNIVWKKIFITNNYDEIPRKIIKTPNGIALCAISNVIGTTASPDMLVFEIDQTINSFLWKNLIGSTDFSGDIPSSMINNSTGGFILVGGTKTFATNYDQVLFRLSNTGLIQSHIAFGSPDNENIHDVIELPNKDLILLSNFRNLTGSGLEMALISIKENNTFNWIKTYGDHGIKDDRPYAFRRTLNGEYFIAGYSYMFGSGDKDLMILRTDQNGTLLNAYNFREDGDQQPFDMAIDNSSFSIVGKSSSNSSGFNDAYVLKEDINITDGNCFAVKIIEDSLSLLSHTFTFNQNDPNIIIDTVYIKTKSLTLTVNPVFHEKKVKGNIIDVLNPNSSDIMNFELGLKDNLNGDIQLVSTVLNNSVNFKLSLFSKQDLLIQGLINPNSPSNLRLKYRNGFDAYQMENIITNQIGAPLQIAPNPYVMIAADVDLNDKIRSNDILYLQEVIVRKIEGFPQELPAELNKPHIDWRFIDKTTVDNADGFKKANTYPYYSSKGYCRDNVPDVPFFLSNQGSCDTNYVETYSAILLGDLVNGGSGVSLNSFDNHSSTITLDIDDVHEIGYNTYRVFLHHTFNSQDKFISLDFALDYDETNISIFYPRMTVEDKLSNPQWLFNDYNTKELLFTSYSMNGYPLKGNLMYIDIYKSTGLPTIADLGQLHVFVNGIEVPATIRLKSQISTGINISKEVSDFVNLYPNPTDDQLTISLPLTYAKDVHIEFLNAIGQSVIVIDQQQASSEIELDLSTLAAGLYHCLIQIQGKANIMKKVVVR